MARLPTLFFISLFMLTPLAAEAAPAPAQPAAASHPAATKKATSKPAASKPAANKTAETPHCTCKPAHPKQARKQAKAHRRRRHLAHRGYNYEKAPALAYAGPPPAGPVRPFRGPEAAPPPPPVEREAPPDNAQRLDPWHGYDGHDGLRNGY